MYRFTIQPNLSWYTNRETNTRERGQFLTRSIEGFYHDNYHGGNRELRETIGTVENIITTLKNQFQDKSEDVLITAGKKLIEILKRDLPQILRILGRTNLTVCIIPRAKALNNYTKYQLIFREAVYIVARDLNGFIDGIDYIIRHTDTRTTHMDRSGYGGEGDLPYPGITIETCTISDDVSGKNILLIDDLYTESINIDEDAIQALLDNGANSVVFYALGKTAPRTEVTL